MDVNTTLQSNAIGSYLAQQQAAARAEPTQSTERQDAATQPAKPAANRSEQVNFSPEALRLSTQNVTSQAPQNVAAPQNANPYPPQTNGQVQEVLTASAQSPAQAINVYHDTFRL